MDWNIHSLLNDLHNSLQKDLRRCLVRLINSFFQSSLSTLWRENMKPIKQRRTPGNRTVTHTKPKKTGHHECALCHGILHGTPRGTVVQIRKMKKSERKPTRPFGGQLCSKCTRDVMSYRAQLKGKTLTLLDVPISIRRYI